MGRIIFGWLRRPYSLSRLKARLTEALGSSYFVGLNSSAPCFSEESVAPEVESALRAHLDQVRWHAGDAFCATVGQLVLACDRLRHGDPSVALSTPATLRRELTKRPTRAARRAIPGPVRSCGPSVPSVAPSAPAALSVVGPAWWKGLLMQPRAEGRGVLVGLDLRRGSGLEPSLGALKSARDEGRPTDPLASRSLPSDCDL